MDRATMRLFASGMGVALLLGAGCGRTEPSRLAALRAAPTAPRDAGSPSAPPDAGLVPADAGSAPGDGGVSPDDAGTADAGQSDGGLAIQCGRELHVFELRQPTADAGHPVIPVKVHVERQGSHVLGLASHEPVHWTVTAAPGVVLEAVVLNGHFPQTADVPPGVSLDSLDATVQVNAVDVCDPGWNLATDGACIDGPFVRSLQQRFGRLLSTFSGCDVCNDLALHDDLSSSLLGPVNTGAGWGYQDDTCL